VASGDKANYTEQGELQTSQESIAKNRHRSETGLAVQRKEAALNMSHSNSL
jgi:hypothetical protein